MSNQAVELVLKHSQSRGAARLLLLAIAHHANPEGKEACPSMETLMEDTKIDDRRLRRLIRELEAAKELTVARGGGHQPNCYAILLPPAEFTLLARPCEVNMGGAGASGLCASGGVGTPGLSTSGGLETPGLSASGGAQTGGGGTPLEGVSRPAVQRCTSVVDVVKEETVQQTATAPSSLLTVPQLTVPQVVAALRAEGITEKVLQELIENHFESIPLYLDCLDDFKPKSRGATLVWSIRGQVPPPTEYWKRKSAERHAQEQQAERQMVKEAVKRQNAAQRAAEREAEAQQEAEAERLDTQYSLLNPNERQEIDRQAAARYGFAWQMTKTEEARAAMRRALMRDAVLLEAVVRDEVSELCL